MVLRASATLILALLLASALPFPTSAIPSADAPLAPALVRIDADSVLEGANAGAFRLDLMGERFAFDLEPHPFALGALVGVNGLPVGRVGETVTFQGTANGHPAAVAATRTGVFALILSEDPILVQPLWVTQPGAPVDVHSVARWSQAPPLIPDHPDPGFASAGPSGPQAPAGGPPEPTNRIARFLIEGDAAFYQATTASETCQAHTEYECWVEVQQALFAMAELLFQRQTGVAFQITSQWACTTAAECPYAGNSPNAWLNAFILRWETRTDEPVHEGGFLYSGVDLNGVAGLAGGLINTDQGYALAEFPVVSAGGGILLTYSTTAHEIGHLFDGIHAQATAIPPLPSPPVPPALENQGAVYTIMAPGKLLTFQFSDGTFDPAKNNLLRIINTANAQLPPP